MNTTASHMMSLLIGAGLIAWGADLGYFSGLLIAVGLRVLFVKVIEIEV